jgi:L-ascorbate metabolism protein UlaG (beta-lactamase superfamily)
MGKATEQNGAQAPPSLLTYVGHATVLLEIAGRRVLTDPLLRWRMGPLLRVVERPPVAALATVDLVLISHAHIDHLDIRSLRRISPAATLVVPRGVAPVVRRLDFARVIEIDVGETIEVDGVSVSAVPALHSGKRYPHLRETPCMGFVIRAGVVVYFAGDTGFFPEMAEIADDIDIALMPIAGWGVTLPEDHLNPVTAAEALCLLRPKIAVPIHWGTYFPPGLIQVWRGKDSGPPRMFVEEAALRAPEVEVVLLEPGESLVIHHQGPPATGRRAHE